MRKLTVKNFSVIKEAELEFGKITVLIGPHASGKSLLCKLAYFLGKQAIDDAVESVLSGESVDDFNSKLTRKFLTWFPIHTWEHENSSVEFYSGSFSARILSNHSSANSGIDILLSPQFVDNFLLVSGLENDGVGSSSDFSAIRREQIRGKFNLLLTDNCPGDRFVHQPLFIPGGRVLFANSSIGFSALQNLDIDPIVREFSAKIAWGNAWKPNRIVGPDALQRLDLIRNEIDEIAGGQIEGLNTNARFRRFTDGKEVPLTLLSSGTQELLPLLNVLEQIITGQRDRILFPRPNSLPGMHGGLFVSKGLIYVEEPEANIFPSTQYALLRLFAGISRERILDFSWVITTHSPYVLATFGNLLKAGKVGAQNPEHRAAVDKTIPEKYWIDNSSFAAYKISDGMLESIYDKSTGQIDGDYLDDVSSDIAEEFGQLLEIQYGGDLARGSR